MERSKPQKCCDFLQLAKVHFYKFNHFQIIHTFVNLWPVVYNQHKMVPNFVYVQKNCIYIIYILKRFLKMNFSMQQTLQFLPSPININIKSKRRESFAKFCASSSSCCVFAKLENQGPSCKRLRPLKCCRFIRDSPSVPSLQFCSNVSRIRQCRNLKSTAI